MDENDTKNDDCFCGVNAGDSLGLVLEGKRLNVHKLQSSKNGRSTMTRKVSAPCPQWP